MLVALSALVGVGLLWQRLSLTQQELARRSAEWQADVAAARALAEQAQASASELQARLGVAELKLSEVVLQRSQLEELMLAVSRSRDDALVQELEATLRLAIQQSQLTGSVQPLVIALQAAQQRLERAAQPRLNPVQRAIARDLARVQSAAVLDVPALIGRLDELARQVDEWPLKADASPPRTEQPKKNALRPARAAPPTSSPASEATSGSPWQRVHDWAELALQQGWERIQASLRDLVRLRRIDSPEAVLLAPEQTYFLREHVRLLLLNARLGVLARQFDSARADVRAVQRHLQRYFDTEQPRVQVTMQTLEELLRDLRHEGLPRPDETLAALAAAAEGR
ncbi:putative uroporphyrinogen-III C-methyltransferase [Tepidimonas charontis]|uniref:Putative uroporphyrinogen-III C-methyltransferase n=1 Tax=Tepidimonas charontis TaxID=2267262 RepID=A0A554XFU1_9BURK|nr:putative uroporphyrinogen-III C-methyltransferase [Tepidimonas charontis]